MRINTNCKETIKIRKRLKSTYLRRINICCLLIFSSVLLMPASAYADNFEKMFNESSVDTGFSKIFIDGFGVNSEGFKLILRNYERLQGTRFKPFLSDVEYILMTQGEVIYSKRVEQIPLPQENDGMTTLSHHAHVALEDGKNYTGKVRIYLYKDGIPEYYLTASSDFTAKNDAQITEVFGDGIGASATLKSKSMVPLNARVNFILKKDAEIIETKDIAAPSIMSNDKEKTVNILWNNSLNEGTYRVSVTLEGTDIIDNHEKMLQVDKIAPAASTAGQPSNASDVPGFTLIQPVLTILIISVLLLRKR